MKTSELAGEALVKAARIQQNCNGRTASALTA